MKRIPFIWLAVSAASIGQLTPGLAAERQTLRNHVPAIVSRLQSVERLPSTNRLHLAIGLPLQNEKALTNLLQQLYDPASPKYRHYLTPEQFAERFGPTEKDYQTLIAFAESNRLTVVARHPNRTLLDVKGTVADIEKTFQVTMRVYQHPTESRKFYAPDVEPSLDLTVPVLQISGLDDYALPRPRLAATPLVNGQNAEPDSGSGPGGTYMGRDFRAAYAPGVTLNGAGQVVGLLQFDGYTASDITYYESLAGLPNITLSNVLIDGASGLPSGSGGEVEVSLDIEMAISMATNVSRVMVYMAPNPSPWEDLLNRMATDNAAKQLSCSWYQPGGGANAVTDQIFQQMAAQGQSFFSASGDNDAFTGLIPFPGDTPYITQVGGTTLTTTGPGGSWVSETVWNWGNGIGSGGGISTQYPIPSWQTNISMAANQGSTTMRNVPDVALTADNVYVRANGVNYTVGGTSCAAPLWAGFAALVNQQAMANGWPVVGFINPAVYAIGQGLNGSSAFHDIATGNNTSSSSPSLFYAVAGYDLCTGWGTPAGIGLINALAPPDALQITPATGFASSGMIGGPFTVTAQAYSLTNAGTAPLDWTLVNTSLWLTASPGGGTLVPGGPATAVTVSLNSAASNLLWGTYAATVGFTNLSDGVGFARQFTLVLYGPPVITTQPANQTVVAGGTAAFAAAATGVPPLSFQWRFGTSNILNATNTTLVLNSVKLDQTGNYSVVVTNALGSTISSNAVLAVVTNVTFDDLTGSKGSVPPDYCGLTWSNFWYVDGVHYAYQASGYTAGVVSTNNVAYNSFGNPASIASTGTFNLISAYLTAAWNDNLQVEVRGYSNGGFYYYNKYTLSATAPTLINLNYVGVDQVTFTSSGGTQHPGYSFSGLNFVMDNVAINKMVVTAHDPPQITAQPPNQTVYERTSVNFGVGAIGSVPLYYQWRKGGLDLDDGIYISGAHTPTLTLSNVLGGSAGGYSVVITNSFGSVTSAVSTLVVMPYDATFVSTGPLIYARRYHTATLLLNGKVLVAGGENASGSLSSAELYDPATGTWTQTGALNVQRSQHTATLLPNGKVLAAGGFNPSSWPYLASAELYDPAAGTWTTTGALHTGRYTHSATLLPNGRVLVAGGYGGNYLSSAELYDPATGIWAATGSMTTAREIHTATLLLNGKVLVAGGYGAGYLSSTELYDPAAETWTATGTMADARCGHTATLLLDGKLLVVGGGNRGNNPVSSAELYDPPTGTWTTTGALNTGRMVFTATLLNSGKVLATGGRNWGDGIYSSSELYDRITRVWSATAPLNTGRHAHTATLLPNGNVLVAGGDNGDFLSSAELYVDQTELSTNCSPPPSGIVAWWPGDGTTLDTVGTNHGTLMNGAAYSSGKVGQAFSFDGVDDYITTPNMGLTNVASGFISNNFTMEFWVYPLASRATTPEANTGISGTFWQRYAIAPNWGGNQAAGAGVSVGTNGISVFEHGAVYLPSLLVYQGAITGWTHVAVVYTNKQPTLYVNGAWVRTGLMSVRSFVYPSAALGGDASAYGYFAGLLDEVSVYDRALTSDEIAAIYAAGSAGKCKSAPVITTQPVDVVTNAGKPVVFWVGAGGTSPLSYHWFKNGVALVDGENTSGVLTPLLTLNSVSASDAGNYSVVITNVYGIVTSTVARLAVGPDFIVVNASDSCSSGSLRQAIVDANTLGFGNIMFSNVSGTITLTNGELVISTNVNIIGPGATNLALSGNNAVRVFNINSSNITVRISGLTIQDGRAADGADGDIETPATDGEPGGGIYTAANLVISNCVVRGNQSGNGGYSASPSRASGRGGEGGGIYAEIGTTLEVVDCVLSNNVAGNGGGFFGGNAGNGGSGGGISGDEVSISRCTVSWNRSGQGGSSYQYSGVGGHGGGVFARNSAICDSVFEGNSAGASGSLRGNSANLGGSGGALYCAGPTLASGCTLRGNAAGPGGDSLEWTGGWGGSGGGACVESGPAVFTNCVFSDNVAGSGGNGADGHGGGGGSGGGLYAASVTVTRCTLQGNRTGNGGAGIDASWGPSNGGPGGDGGGLYCSGGLIGETILTSNQTGFGGSGQSISVSGAVGGRGGNGGGAWVGSGVTVRNCLFAGNAAGAGGSTSGHNVGTGGNGGSGGGCWVYAATILSCTIVDGEAGLGGSGYTPGASGSGGGVFGGEVHNSIVYSNTALTGPNFYGSSIDYSCTTPLPAGIGNIAANPLFTYGYRLYLTSPCINAGTNQAWMASATDLDGNPRISCGVVDMGAFELIGCFAPRTPALLAHATNTGTAYGVAVAGHYAYLACDGLRIYDVTDPANPVNVGYTNNGSAATAVAITDHYAVVANSHGLRIYDVSDPANPANISYTNNGGWAQNVAVSGHYAYLANDTDGLRIYDISDPANPVNVGHSQTNYRGRGFGIAAAGSYVYLANDSDGLRIFDVSDPGNPINIGHANDGGAAWDVAVSGDYAYLANSSDGLRIYNVFDPANPISVGHINDGGSAADVVVVGRLAYVANGNDGLRVYNITDPSAPLNVAWINTGGFANGVAVAGPYIYIANNADGLRIYYLANTVPGMGVAVSGAWPQLTLWGLPGDMFRILASTNLLDWQTIGSVMNYSDSVQFNDTEATNFSRRFYRAVTP